MESVTLEAVRCVANSLDENTVQTPLTEILLAAEPPLSRPANRIKLWRFRKQFQRQQSGLAVVLALEDPRVAARILRFNFNNSDGRPFRHHDQPLRSNQERQSHIIIRCIEF